MGPWRRNAYVAWISAAWPVNNRREIDRHLEVAAKRVNGVYEIASSVGVDVQAGRIPAGSANVRIIFSRTVQNGEQLRDTLKRAMYAIQSVLSALSEDEISAIGTDLMIKAYKGLADYHRNVATECGSLVTVSEWGYTPR
jgi:hypothetical protein